MQALEFWKAVANDKSNSLERVVGLLEEHDIPYCVIGGQAVNAYVEPLVSLDLDLAVAIKSLDTVRSIMEAHFPVKDFPHSLNVSPRGSDLRVQFQKKPAYGDFVTRAKRRSVLGIELPVARIEDVLQGKIWAAMEETRRSSKRRKDLLDIERILESFPGLRSLVPDSILERLG